MKSSITRTLSILCLFLACNIQAQQHSREQTGFGAEGDFQKPIPLPAAALQALRASQAPDDEIQNCAEQQGIQASAIPASWFVASEIRLRQAAASGLVVRGEQACLGGAHIAQFWVLSKSGTGYQIVFRGRADSLQVLPRRTNGYRDLQLLIVTAAGRNVSYVTFRYSNGAYRLSGQRTEHPN